MESIKRKIEISVIKYLEKYSIGSGSSIVAAWSGGPDSTVLISILKDLEKYNFKITAAWFNHRLRTEAEMAEEEATVEKTAARLGVRLVKGHAAAGEIKDRAEDAKLSLEDAARKVRYNFLQKVVLDNRADYIALGHNLNDNTETMMMRFLLNSGTAGLAGIPEKRDQLIRPLCGVPRSDIEKYIENEKLDVSIDRTNLEDVFLRNKIRLNIIPEIKKFIPEIDGNMSGLAGKLRLQNDFIDHETEKRLKWTECAEGWKINQNTFYSEHRLLRIRSIFSIINRMGFSERVRYTAVEDAVRGENPGNGKILLKTSAFELTSGSGHIFIQRLVNHNKKSYFIYLEPGTEASFCGQKVSAFEIGAAKDERYSDDDNRIILPVNGPLTVRSYRDGDYIDIENGRKSLKKLFSEWKVSLKDRNSIPVIEDRGIVITVAGSHLGYKNRISCSSRSCSDNKKILLVFNSDTETTCE